MKYRTRRVVMVLVALVSVLAGIVTEAVQQHPTTPVSEQVSTQKTVEQTLALQALETLQVKGRAPKTGYSRAQFSADWGEVNNCSLRELVLRRDLMQTVVNEDGCRVMSGTLNDPYSGKTIQFQRGPVSSQAVQIDHIVAVSDAWQKGAQQLTPQLRYQFYNDPLNLLAVDGPTNNNKGDGDAATWLPPSKDYRCRYIARQIAVKAKYTLWVTSAERNAMQAVLSNCPEQILPIVQNNG